MDFPGFTRVFYSKKSVDISTISEIQFPIKLSIVCTRQHSVIHSVTRPKNSTAGKGEKNAYCKFLAFKSRRLDKEARLN